MYLLLKEEDIENALDLIWTNKVEGWWHYMDKFAELDICTKEESGDALTRQVGNNKSKN